MFAGLDIGGKHTAICVIDESGKLVWRGIVDTHPEMIDAALRRFKGALDKVGLESGPFTPHLCKRDLTAPGFRSEAQPLKKSGFEHPFQARQSRLGMAS
jgi:predicted NBD/HSP70 family sugar kinase